MESELGHMKKAHVVQDDQDAEIGEYRGCQVTVSQMVCMSRCEKHSWRHDLA